MHSLDLIVFSLYILGISLVGALFYRKNKSSAAFILGNSNIPAWVLSLSIFATFVSSISYLALPGIAYQSNWNSFVFSLSLPIAAVVAIKYFIPIYREINSPSAYTYLEIRFGAWARVYAASMYLLTQAMRIGTILYLMALIPNTIFGWDIVSIIVVTSIIVMGYSMMGGIQAVVWTDAIQGIILIVGAIVCVVIIFFKMPDGASQVLSIASDNDKFSLGSFSLSLKESTFWVVFVYGIFINLQNFSVDQNYIQRYMSSRSLAEAQKSAFWGGMLYVPVSLLFLFIGTSLFAYYNSGGGVLPEELQDITKSDRIFPFFIANELPPGVKGLLISSIFAAGMSTISTSYNSSATIFLTDFYEKYSKGIHSERSKMITLYIASAVIGVLGMLIGIAMINVKSTLDTWWKLASIFSGGILGLFLLGAFTKTKNVIGAVIGVLVGLMIIIWLSLSNIFLGPEALGNQFHTYLTIVFGTSAILIVGFLIGLLGSKSRHH